MVEYKIKGNKIQFYDDIKDCPIENFTQFKKYVTLHMTVDPKPEIPFGYVDETIAKIFQFIDSESKDYVKQELQNFRQAVFLRMQEIDICNLAIASVIHSINGVEFDYKTDEDLQKACNDYLVKATVKTQQEILSHVKKNFLKESN